MLKCAFKTMYWFTPSSHVTSYIKTLKPPDIHHIIAPFWNNAHDLHSFLQETKVSKMLIGFLNVGSIKY